jgi:hypothetical protein
MHPSFQRCREGPRLDALHAEQDDAVRPGSKACKPQASTSCIHHAQKRKSTFLDAAIRV